MPSASKRRAAEREARRRQRLTVAGVVGVVVALAAIAVLSTALGGEDGAADGARQTRSVRVEGDALPPLPGQGPDPAVGATAPTLSGSSFNGDPVEVPGTLGGAPQAIWFLAHWCPHCQAEVPAIVRLANAGSIPDGIDVVAVSTSVDESAPNYPPSAWLEREGWRYPVLVDDAQGTAARAYGVEGFPFLVVVDADGTVLVRTSGELGELGIVSLLDRVADGSG